ncbi:hypothetical protein BJ508DRAFT_365188 [Ascobolus immersus RN42]|uniref:DUF7918 domain-containing protein n=1 Tax=Ascobolus immersus RN42 TaxID=1160509 RepID=A0A3N4HSE0_ASCIM|nr:hypothetical protein BJ508DRAFT_365188 [Ascobolus immersus RN42]
MVGFIGFGFSVESNNRPLREYAYPDQEPPNTKTIYLEVPPSDFPLPFKIRVATNLPVVDLGYCVTLTVDGIKDAYSKQVASWQRNPTGFIYDGIRIYTPDATAAITRELLLKPLETTEENEETYVNPKDIGSIIIKINKIVGTTELAGLYWQHQGYALEGKISEKKLKGSSSSHCAGIGREIGKISKPMGFTWKLEDPQYTLRFLYRSRAALQSLGIVAQEPPPYRIKREWDEVDLILDITSIKREPDTNFKEEPNVKMEPNLKQELRRFLLSTFSGVWSAKRWPAAPFAGGGLWLGAGSTSRATPRQFVWV